MYWFTADEHYGHANIIKYCARPFDSVYEMDAELVARHNAVVSMGDTVVHVGDFTLACKEVAATYAHQLNGHHVFLKGSHDRWLGSSAPVIWEKRIAGIWVVACHYAMRTWPRSHYGSVQLYGHSHGMLVEAPSQWDVGVDNNGYAPVADWWIIEKLRATIRENRRAEKGRCADEEAGGTDGGRV